MSRYNFDLVGLPPDLTRQVLDELIGEEYHSPEGPPACPHIVYLLIQGRWWRVFTDGPMLYWKSWDKAPEAWDMEEYGSCPLRDLGTELGLRGKLLTGWSYDVQNHAPSLSLNFDDGHQITLYGEGDSWTTFELVHWEFSNPHK